MVMPLLMLAVLDDSSSSEDDDINHVLPAVAALFVLSKYLFVEKTALMTRLVNPGFDLNGANDATFNFFFRFTATQIKRMAIAFGLPDRLPLRCRVSGFKGLCILLHRFAYPSRLGAEAHFWGVGHSPSQLSTVTF